MAAGLGLIYLSRALELTDITQIFVVLTFQGT